jgi:hypothetical protein
MLPSSSTSGGSSVQASGYLLICLRQAILRLPAACAPRLAGLGDEHAIREVLKDAALALLNELKDLPAKVVDENWLAKVEEDGEPAKKAPKTIIVI